MPKNFAMERFCAVFQKICGSEKAYSRSERGVKREGVRILSFETFLSCSTKKFTTGTLLPSRKFLVPKNVRDKRSRGYHDFPSKLFCLTRQIHFIEEPFCVSESFVYQKILCLWGEISRFPIENLSSHSTEKFPRRSLLCSTNFWSQKSLRIREGEGITISR